MTAPTRRRLSSDKGDNHVSGGFHRRPSAIVCQGCGGQYFAASLPIHQKTCFERNPFVDVACPECRAIVKTGKLWVHLVACDGQVRLSAESLRAKPTKPETSPEELNAPEADGRVRCRNCDRAFHAERIAKHQSVCAGTRRRVPPPSSTVNAPIKPSAHRVRSPIKSASPTRRSSNAIRARVSIDFSGSSSAAARSQSTAWGRKSESNRFALVHRDGARRFESSGYTGTGSARLALSTSTATSASNPLATSRFMTLSSW